MMKKRGAAYTQINDLSLIAPGIRYEVLRKRMVPFPGALDPTNGRMADPFENKMAFLGLYVGAEFLEDGTIRSGEFGFSCLGSGPS